MRGLGVRSEDGRGRRGEVGEVNNESVPNSFSEHGGVGLGEASGALVCLLVPWCQECRSVEVKALGRLPRLSGCCYCLTAGPTDTISTYLAPELSAPALSDLRDRSSHSLLLSQTEYISRFVHLPLLSPSLSPSQLLSPQASRPSFDFPINPGYGAWKWLDPIILVVGEQPEVIQNEIVTVWGLLGDARRVKLWLSSFF